MFEFDLFTRGDWIKLATATIALLIVLAALVWWMIDAFIAGKLAF